MEESKTGQKERKIQGQDNEVEAEEAVVHRKKRLQIARQVEID